MAAPTILSDKQTQLLQRLALEPFVSDHFYLTGGTALAEFYLHHRLSEDLDFFSSAEVDSAAIAGVLKKISPDLGIKKVEFQQSFNRNLFFIDLPGETIKTEFTYFPFLPIEKSKIRFENLTVDSLFDIAVNKIFTIYQKPRSRDFIDLYYIIQKEKWTIVELVKKAKIKFDWHIDLIQLGAQMLEAVSVKDYPRMIKKISPETWQKFFIDEAKKLKDDILD